MLENQSKEHYIEFVKCPLVNDDLIQCADCIENSDTADGMLKPDHMPTRFIQNPNWREICKKCQYHGI